MPRQPRTTYGHTSAPVITVAYPWIEEKDYAIARQIMFDGDLWPTSYDVWRREAERAMSALSVEGVTSVKARLDLEEFGAWCRTNDCPADSAARLAFAEIVAWRAAESEADE